MPGKIWSVVEGKMEAKSFFKDLQRKYGIKREQGESRSRRKGCELGSGAEEERPGRGEGMDGAVLEDLKVVAK